MSMGYVPTYALVEPQSLARWMILKVMVGKRYYIDILHDYYVRHKSPKEISMERNVNYHQVTSIVYNAYVLGRYRKQNERIIARIVSAILQVIDEIPVIAEPLDKRMHWCRLCNYVISTHNIENHVTRKHRDVVTSIIDDVLSMISL